MFLNNKLERGVLCDVFGVGAGVGGVAQAAGQIGAAGIQAGATISAANTQADAARYASDQSLNAATQANNLQRDQFTQQQQNLAPWLDTGKSALSGLATGLQTGQYDATGISGFYGANQNSGVNTQMAAPAGFKFDASNLENDPGYQFQLQQGMKALENQQSAIGVSGGAAGQALERYAQDYAGTSYNTAYQRALGTYQTNFGNQFQVGQANIQNAQQDYSNAWNRGLTQTQNNFNAGQQAENTNWNRVASLAGLGQTANAQLGQAGQQYANQVGYNTTNAAAQAGNYATQGANARAAQYVGLGNNIGGTLMNLGQNYNQPQVTNYYGEESNDNFF